MWDVFFQVSLNNWGETQALYLPAEHQCCMVYLMLFSLKKQDIVLYIKHKWFSEKCFAQTKESIKKGKNALKLNYTGEKEYYNWSSFN